MSSLAGVFGLEQDRTASLVALCAAIGLHAAIALAANIRGASAPPPLIVSEVELAPPPPPPPPAPVVEPEPDPPVANKAAVAAPAAAPAAARAGSILAAAPTAPSANDLVDFTSDPSATTYGSGVVAAGGLLDHGTGAAKARVSAPAPAPAATGTTTGGTGITPAGSLRRAAKIDGEDPCKGFYPSDAIADEGRATVSVVVLPTGKIAKATLVSESPPHQGFGTAAHRCMSSATFVPAVDKAGQIATASLTVSVRFTR